MLNGSKADGSERLTEGDTITLYLADDTIRNFSGDKGSDKDAVSYINAFRTLSDNDHDPIRVLYEDDNIILMHKPAGVLSQKAREDSMSLNEWLVGYLLDKGSIEASSLTTFRPSVANRLDRNTTGIVIGTKSLTGAVKISEMIRERRLIKIYHAIVDGIMDDEGIICAAWEKDKRTNRVSLREAYVTDRIPPDAFLRRRMCTQFFPMACNEEEGLTLVQLNLLTGKTHQLRVGLAAIGFPIIGDPKYGGGEDEDMPGAKRQLLHAFGLSFPDNAGAPFEDLAGKFFADEPDPLFADYLQKYFSEQLL